MAYGARGIARQDGWVWFVDGAIPGQKIKARVKKRRKTYGECAIQEVLAPSPWQVHPPCGYFGTCGGCKLQHMDYAKQVEYKTNQVKDLLQRVGGLKEIQMLPAQKSSDIFHYRNKMEFTFSDNPWLFDNINEQNETFALGLHAPRRFDKIIHMNSCLLQPSIANEILNVAGNTAGKSRLKPYNCRTHQGFWRYLVIRTAHFTNECMVNIITSSQCARQGEEEVDHLAQIIQKNCPEVNTLLHSVTDAQAQTAFSESERVIFGSGKISEKICGKLFEISPNSFFQTNSRQTEVLFQTLLKLADLKGNETVYDLYCGTGAIGIILADHVQSVIGIEVIKSAVANGNRNIDMNGIRNMSIIEADMKDALSDTAGIIEKFGRPDIAVLDPPRGGTHPKTIKNILKLKAPKIIYVSCNPSILARDLSILCEDMYDLTAIQPVDMFPHTGHIETVAVLKRRN